MMPWIQALKSHRWYTFAGIVGFLCVYALIHDVIPQIIEIVKMQKTIRHNEITLAQVDEYDWNIRRMVKNKEKLDQQIESLIYSQQQKNQFSSIYAFLFDNARNRELTILNIKSGDAESGNRFIRLPVSLRMEARFHALAEYLNTLETSEPIILIDSWSIEAKEMISPNLTVNLVLWIYFLT